MAKRLQLRGGTTAQHSTFTGAVREVTVDTDKDTLVVHDGSTAGGFPLAKYSDVTAISTDLVNDTTPQLGGNLDLNSSDITGTGNVNITGTVTATSFSGDGSALTGLAGGDVVDDTTPQLGGNLDLNTNNITGTGNIDNVGTITTDGLTVAGNVSIDGGSIKLDGNYPVGSNNVALGDTALDDPSLSGNHNVAIGAIALSANTGGSCNVSVGAFSSKLNNTGCRNTAVGYQSFCSNTTGCQNTAIGLQALHSTTTGANNTALGYKALCLNTTANNNTAVGYLALCGNTTGAQNTALGIIAGTIVTTGTNITLLGYNTQPSSGTATNEITFGDTNVATLRAQVTTITAISDKRDKTNICDLNVGLDFINDLKPVTFDWNMRDGSRKGRKDVGFIAQDLDEVQQKYNIEENLQLVLKTNPERLEAGQGKLIPVLVNAIKELKAQNEDLKSRIEALET